MMSHASQYSPLAVMHGCTFSPNECGRPNIFPNECGLEQSDVLIDDHHAVAGCPMIDAPVLHDEHRIVFRQVHAIRRRGIPPPLHQRVPATRKNELRNLAAVVLHREPPHHLGIAQIEVAERDVVPVIGEPACPAPRVIVLIKARITCLVRLVQELAQDDRHARFSDLRRGRRWRCRWKFVPGRLLVFRTPEPEKPEHGRQRNGSPFHPIWLAFQSHCGFAILWLAFPRCNARSSSASTAVRSRWTPTTSACCSGSSARISTSPARSMAAGSGS